MKAELTRIIYVEDEPDIRSIAKIALQDIGKLTVCFCASGREAIAAIPEFKPQLVILDVMMPDLDGPSTLLELHKLPAMQDVPVIYMTARVQSNEIAEYMNQKGVVHVIAKPFDPITLADDIRKCWATL